MTVSVLGLCLALATGSASRPVVEPPERIASEHRDTIDLVVPEGDTAALPLREFLVRLESNWSFATLAEHRLRFAPTAAGDYSVKLRSVVGRVSKIVRVHVVRRRSIGLWLQAVGVSPSDWTDSVSMARLRQELSKLVEGSGIELRLNSIPPAALPPSPSFWDPDGGGHLDLLRNDDSLRPAPALDSLVGWMGRHDMAFPRVVIFQSPVRVGWGLGTATRPGDSLLVLANQTTFPWRDGKGAAIRYVLGDALGRHADTFQVTGYAGDTIRIRTTAADGRFAYAHDRKTDLVLRPDQANPPFGLSPSWKVGAAPIIVLPDGRKLEDPKRAARVIAHEVCHTLGLPHRDEKTNLMCPVLLMDVEHPVLSPDQILSLHEKLNSTPSLLGPSPR